MTNQISFIEVALALLQDEVNGDIVSAKAKMGLDNYSMTWMYRTGDTLFPSVQGEMLKGAMDEVYKITDRQYEIMNTAQDANVVFIEMIESYPDTETGKEYRTPLTLVLEFNDGGKVVRGRHYCDPQISHEFLEEKVILNALKQKPILVVKSKAK